MSRVPLSLEEIARQHKLQQEEANKPKFLSKVEREQLAIQRREQEEEEQRKAHEEEQQRRMEFLRGKQNRTMDIDSNHQQHLRPDELDAIKKRYLGGDEKHSKKLRRFTEKRFIFDWDDSDDTGLNQSLQYYNGRRLNHGKQISKEDDADLHWSQKRLDQMKERDYRILKEDFNISTKGGGIAHPLRYWEESNLGKPIIDLLNRFNLTEPTPIQRQAIPVALQKRDLIGIAETGSGKTLAFLLPMLSYIQKLPRLNDRTALDGPYGLILAPTRELVQQIEQEAKRFAQHLGYHVISIIGGRSMSEQSILLRKGVEIVIATPGRLRDCLEQHALVLNQCYSLVLDEADRMIDMNFEEDLNFILSVLPTNIAKPDNEYAEKAEFLEKQLVRQTTMFSATMPPSVEALAKLYLRRPAMITVGQAGQAVDRIAQKIIMTNDYEKPNLLISTLQENETPVIIFVNQKTSVETLYNRLSNFGFQVVSLHGGKGQDQRDSAISQLKSGNKDILIATDIASRGIDIKDVALVVNYDMSKSIEDYVHRIGRTGRAGKEGKAITFLTDKDVELYYDLRVLLEKSKNSSLPADFVNHDAARQRLGAVVQKKRHEEKIFAFGV